MKLKFEIKKHIKKALVAFCIFSTMSNPVYSYDPHLQRLVYSEIDINEFFSQQKMCSFSRLEQALAHIQMHRNAAGRSLFVSSAMNHAMPIFVIGTAAVGVARFVGTGGLGAIILGGICASGASQVIGSTASSAPTMGSLFALGVFGSQSIIDTALDELEAQFMMHSCAPGNEYDQSTILRWGKEIIDLRTGNAEHPAVTRNRLADRFAFPKTKTVVGRYSATEVEGALWTLDKPQLAAMTMLVRHIIAMNENPLSPINYRLISYFYGVQGSGKTTTSRNIAKLVGLPYCEISLAGITKEKFYGTEDIAGELVTCLIRSKTLNPVIIINDGDLATFRQGSVAGEIMVEFLDSSVESVYSEFLRRKIDLRLIPVIMTGNSPLSKPGESLEVIQKRVSDRVTVHKFLEPDQATKQRFLGREFDRLAQEFTFSSSANDKTRIVDQISRNNEVKSFRQMEFELKKALLNFKIQNADQSSKVTVDSRATSGEKGPDEL